MGVTWGRHDNEHKDIVVFSTCGLAVGEPHAFAIDSEGRAGTTEET